MTLKELRALAMSISKLEMQIMRDGGELSGRGFYTRVMTSKENMTEINRVILIDAKDNFDKKIKEFREKLKEAKTKLENAGFTRIDILDEMLKIDGSNFQKGYTIAKNLDIGVRSYYRYKRRIERILCEK